MESIRKQGTGRSCSPLTTQRNRLIFTVSTPLTREMQAGDAEERCLVTRHAQKTAGPGGWTRPIQAFAPLRDCSLPRTARPTNTSNCSKEPGLTDFLIRSCQLREKIQSIVKNNKSKRLISEGRTMRLLRKRTPVRVNLPRLHPDEFVVC